VGRWWNWFGRWHKERENHCNFDLCCFFLLGSFAGGDKGGGKWVGHAGSMENKREGALNRSRGQRERIFGDFLYFGFVIIFCGWGDMKIRNLRNKSRTSKEGIKFGENN